MLSRWLANTKRVLAHDKVGNKDYDFESKFPDGASDGTPFSASEMNKIIDGVNQNTPVGTVMIYAGATAPTGWLLCQGQEVSRTTYPALFALLQTTGNGTTTFNLIDLRGIIPVGYDSTQPEFNILGKNGGEKRHTLTESELAAHTHGTTYGRKVSDAADWGNDYPVSATATDYNTRLYSEYTGGNGSHNNLQPYIVLNYIIKY